VVSVAGQASTVKVPIVATVGKVPPVGQEILVGS